MKQIELFVSGGQYIVPSTGKKVSFTEFCSNLEKTYDFPVLDFDGRVTCGEDKEFTIGTTATAPHMVTGIRRYFYQFQVFGALLILSIQLYSTYQTAGVFSVIALGPVSYLILVAYAKIRERNFRYRKGQKSKEQTCTNR
jgi:hypothetical protein